MKFRKGFVSNSSSSSFVAYEDSAFDVAKQMIPLRDWKGDNALLKLLDGLKGIVDCDSIMFSSCNYDTYIAKVEDEDKFVIHTCNNHAFWEVDCLDEVREGSKEDEMEFDGIEFFDLENQIYFKRVPYEDRESFEERWCSKHSSDVVEITRGEFAGKHMCPGCIKKDEKEDLLNAQIAINKSLKSTIKSILSGKATEKDIDDTMKKIKNILMKEIK